jgi:hypothetical protein
MVFTLRRHSEKMDQKVNCMRLRVHIIWHRIATANRAIRARFTATNQSTRKEAHKMLKQSIAIQKLASLEPTREGPIVVAYDG